MKGFKAIFMVPAALIVAGAFAAGCSDSEESAPTLLIKTNPVTAVASCAYLTVTAESDWVLTSTETWLSFDPAIGYGDDNAVIMNWDANSDESSRSTTITISDKDGRFSSYTLTQNASESSSSSSSGSTSTETTGTGQTSTGLGWMELPETDASDGYEFFTHDMTVSGVSTRNYSFYYDYDNYVAQWVAYPLSTWNKGSGSRTNAWAYDPLIDEDKQPNLASGFKSGSTSYSYDRGHQIPSADRYSTTAANQATFYYTNMTPQLGSLNQYVWGNLEGAVRTWASESDTLYVLTGCVTTGSTDYALDNDEKHITIPTAYYKALLRYAPESTLGYEGYMGIAFWFEHKTYGTSEAYKDHAISIAELEDALGFELFVNLPDMVGESTTTAIKAEDPLGSSDNAKWWW